MKTKLTFILFIYFFCISLYSQNHTLSSYKLENLKIEVGDGGNKRIVLADREYIPIPETDLLLHFNDTDFIDSSDNYTVTRHYKNINTREKILGKGSAYFINNEKIVVSSDKDTMFTKGRVLGDFTIEFWLNPTIIGSDSSIFTWKGVNKVEKEFISQRISCYFENRNLAWSFDNIFSPEDLSKLSIKLLGSTKLIPKKWSHHLLRYNSDTGIIEYLMDGIPEDITYGTKDKKESRDILTPYIGNFSKNELFIGERYRGFIDEFRISESFIEEPQLTGHWDTGVLYSQVFDLEEEKLLEDLIFKDIVSDETLINYYYRTSSLPFVSSSELEWLPYSGSINEVTRYLQIKGEFYSSGNKDITPEFYGFNIKSKNIPKPPPPEFITVEEVKNGIKLSWNSFEHLNIHGYKVYIGSKPNIYEEVIDIGNNSFYTIDNLVSNKIYYFSIRSYNYRNSEGNYSKEVYGRPK